MSRPIIIPVFKDRDRYVFQLDEDPASFIAMCAVMGRYAANPELSFGWYDFAVVAQKAQRTLRARAAVAQAEK